MKARKGSLFFPCLLVAYPGTVNLKLRLHEASRETSEMGRLPAPICLPRVNFYPPEIRRKSGWKQVLISGGILFEVRAGFLNII
jgi:hypothetical protein